MTELIAQLVRVSEFAPAVVWPAAAIFTRLSLMIFMMPGLGTRIIPVNVKVMIALALTFLLFPVIGSSFVGSELPVHALLVGEAFVGFALGFLVRIMMFVLSIAGAAIAQSLSLSQIFGAGITEESNTTVSTLLIMAGGTVFLSLGGHILLFEIFVSSYQTLPPGMVFVDDALGAITGRAVEASGEAIAFALVLSAPFLLMNLAYNILLGVLNRAMPQLMVTFVGMPAITLSGLVLLMVSVSGILMHWREVLETSMAALLP